MKTNSIHAFVLFSVLLAGVLLMSSGPLRADPPHAKSNARSSDTVAADDRPLDDQLLDDLDNDLLNGLDVVPDMGETPPDEPALEGQTPLDADLIEQLIEGEDIGEGQDAAPHLRIGKRMQVAQQRIRARMTAATTQRLQQKVIDDLDRLIEELKKKGCCDGGEGQSKAGPTGQGKPNEKPGEGGRQAAADSRPTKSTERVGTTETAEADAERFRALVKQIWGHLPERVRDRMPNTSDEEFLPKYAELIEDYFQRLADEGGEDR